MIIETRRATKALEVPEARSMASVMTDEIQRAREQGDTVTGFTVSLHEYRRLIHAMRDELVTVPGGEVNTCTFHGVPLYREPGIHSQH